ncbi:Putative 2-hydroxyacid dehydrogenase [Mycobacterium talmoniae]|uniref:2-hydroxyacid dehydrogenase n=1 Tax=Mycobacterium talmoniae TaxID=1858794 RepID=A0A2S8BBX1_9MYCO|nr:Putative 2-hydroxyacid dehydrogenase [Mycobacterium talmoniae]
MLAAPLTEQTRGMMNADALAALPPRARLINVGRGELVLTDALVAALQTGRWPGQHSTSSTPNRCRPAIRCGPPRMCG